MLSLGGPNMPKDIHAHLRNETVVELQPPPGLRVAPETSVLQTVRQMQQARSGCALVCQGNKLVGIFTEQDYLRRVLAKQLDPGTPISAVMSPPKATVRLTDSIATVVNRIHGGRYRRLPVVDANDELVGCVSVRNLVHHLAEHFPAAVYNLAPASKQVQQEREGA
jgi:CBS domain-containing protein